jgi:hypothetical protein
VLFLVVSATNLREIAMAIPSRYGCDVGGHRLLLTFIGLQNAASWPTTPRRWWARAGSTIAGCHAQRDYHRAQSSAPAARNRPSTGHPLLIRGHLL